MQRAFAADKDTPRTTPNVEHSTAAAATAATAASDHEQTLMTTTLPTGGPVFW